MDRTVLVGILALAGGCNLPLVMLEVEAPEVCVTERVDIDATSVSTGMVVGDDMLPADMAADLSTRLGTTIELDNNVIDLPAEAKDLLDLDVQISLVRITPLAPHADALDDVDELSIVINPPAGSGLSSKTILAMVSDPAAPSGTPLEARGDMINLAAYLYAGQLTFDYRIDADVTVPEAWQADVTTCVRTRGYVDASINDAMNL